MKIKMFRYSSLAGSLNEFEEKVNDFMKDFEIATVEQKVIPNKKRRLFNLYTDFIQII